MSMLSDHTTNTALSAAETQVTALPSSFHEEPPAMPFTQRQRYHSTCLCPQEAGSCKGGQVTATGTGRTLETEK